MLAASLNARLAPCGIHYGWVMVGLTVLVSLSSDGAMGYWARCFCPCSARQDGRPPQSPGPLPYGCSSAG